MGWIRGLAVNEMMWLRHARMLICGGVFRGFSGGLVPCGGVRRPFSRVCDTPVDVLFSNGSRVVREGPGCVIAGVRVSLPLAAWHGGLAPEGIGAACRCGGGLRTQERICTTSL